MTITCNAGFKASGTATLNCVNGKYDAAVPQCIGKHRSISLYKPSPTSNSSVTLQSSIHFFHASTRNRLEYLEMIGCEMWASSRLVIFKKPKFSGMLKSIGSITMGHVRDDFI